MGKLNDAMKDFNFNKYNTAVRRAMSDKYVECIKRKHELNMKCEEYTRRLNEERETLSYLEYIHIEHELKILESTLHDCKVQIDIWDQARTVCMDLADDML